jgi:hypothetical protein
MATYTLTTPAEARELDFSVLIEPSKSKAGKRHLDHPELSMEPKAIRNRTRRRGKITQKEFNALYKPIEEWDEEELARGRPRAADGSFRGASPQWLTREMHEKAMERFKSIIGGRMRQEAVSAIGVVSNLLNSTETDDKGKPVVPPSVQLQAAQWLVEHIVGKPTQRTETDISVKLQAVLAQAMIGGVQPEQSGQVTGLGTPDYGAAFATPAIEAEAWEEDDDVDDVD